MRATTYEEVSSGALNSPEARSDMAIDLTHTALRGLYKRGLIVGAMLFGSAFSGDLFREPDINPLSDLDVLVVTKGDYGEGMRSLRDIHALVLGRLAVSLEMTWLTEQQAQAGDHTVAQPMHVWLQRQVILHPEMVIGEDPTELLEPIDVDLDEYTDRWFQETRSRFQKASVSPHQALPWALSLPHIAARRSIDALKYTRRAGQTDKTPLDVTREGIRAAVQDIYGKHDPEIWELYQKIEGMQRDFLSFLMDEVSTGEVSKTEYNATIEAMASRAIPEVLKLLDKMHDAFGRVGYPVLDDAHFRRVQEANGRIPTYQYFTVE